MYGLLPIAWTLCYEEQFYLIAGLIRRRYFEGIALVSIAVLLWPFKLPGFFFDGLWFHFAAGVAVYYALNRDKRAALLLIAAMMCVFYPSVFSGVRANSFDQSNVIAFGFAMLLIVLKPLDNLLSWGPLLGIGKFSYSIYLIHMIPAQLASDFMPGPAWLVALTGIAVSISGGYAFYRLVEARWLPVRTVSIGGNRSYKPDNLPISEQPWHSSAELEPCEPILL